MASRVGPLRLLVGHFLRAPPSWAAYATWPSRNMCASGAPVADMGHDDPFLATIRFAPVLFIVAGVLMVVWLSHQRMPHEWQGDVLEAMSETEPLPPSSIRQRPPLAHQDLDAGTLQQVLEHLCHDGLAVRWYEADSAEPVYRRVARP
jgi:hypothetical protein